MAMTLKKNEVQAPVKEQAKVDPKADPKAKVAPATEAPKEPKVLTPTPPVAETKEEPKDQATDKHADERAKFKAMTMDQVWSFFGGADKRGVVSQAIRHLNAIGFTRGEVATITGKRYQHVRNVLVEDARAKKD